MGLVPHTFSESTLALAPQPCFPRVLPSTKEVVARINRDSTGPHGPREVMCGIRPEDIRLGSAESDSSKPRALVDLVEGLGSDAYVSLSVGDTMLLARTPADAWPTENENVTLDLNLNKLHLFDFESELSILNYG